jgi:cleavage stimulation factor subunit 1
MAATGSADNSIKVLDVPRMLASDLGRSKAGSGSSSAGLLAAGGAGSNPEEHPILCSFFDHTSMINELVFHPVENWLFSCAKDFTIKLWDLNKKQNRRPVRQAVDTCSVRTIDLHPSGEFLVAGTDNPLIRVYDVATLRAYVPCDANHHHYAPVNQVRWSSDGVHYASAGKDGSFKLWDAVTGKNVRTALNCHAGAEVSSVRFSADSRKILTSGRDSTVKLWDAASGKEAMVLQGAVQRLCRSQAIFDASGNYVVSADEHSCCLVVWSAHTGAIVRKIYGHSKPIRYLECSPVDTVLWTCSEDSKARLWCREDD